MRPNQVTQLELKLKLASLIGQGKKNFGPLHVSKMMDYWFLCSLD